MKTDELKPCPFCGKIPRIIEAELSSVKMFVNDGYKLICECKIIANSYDKELLIRFWNTRQSESPLLAEIEEWKKKYQAIEDIYKAFNTSVDAIQQLLNEILAGRKAQAELQRLKDGYNQANERI